MPVKPAGSPIGHDHGRRPLRLDFARCPMSMPLTDPDLRHLADRLRQRHRELRSAIRELFADHDDPETMALRNRLEDTDDWAVADAMQGFDIAMVAREVAEIAEVEGALRRMSEGGYGQCVDCDEPIPAARLHAYPAASRCVGCQEAVERRATARGGAA
jgi:DnaK suppressor protein